MPKVIDTSYMHLIRISLVVEDDPMARVNAVFAYLKEETKISKVLCCRHNGKNGKNPHVHIVVEGKITGITMRNHVKEHVLKSSYSIKKGDGNAKCYSYLFKECVRANCCEGDVCQCVLYKKGVSDTEVKELKEMSLLHSKVDSKFKMVNELVPQVDEVQAKHRCWSLHKCMFSLIMSYYDSEWVPTKFQAERYLTTLEREYARYKNGDKGVEDFCDSLYRQYFL